METMVKLTQAQAFSSAINLFITKQQNQINHTYGTNYNLNHPSTNRLFLRNRKHADWVMKIKRLNYRRVDVDEGGISTQLNCFIRSQAVWCKGLAFGKKPSRLTYTILPETGCINLQNPGDFKERIINYFLFVTFFI